MALNKERLIEDLVSRGYLKTAVIIESFKNIDRKDFMASEYRDLAYIDEAMPIGFGQTISQPLTVAFMMELLEPKPGDKILDLGSGSAWTTALLAYIVGERGKVFGIEKIPELVKFGRKNLAKYKFKNAEILPAGKKLGLPKEAPSALNRVEGPALSRAEGFDRILVSAAAEELPQELINQLKIGGRLVIPIRHSIWKIDKISEKDIRKEEYYGFSFVPLVQ